MREKARIVRIVELVGQLWDMFPNQRIGQLLVNFVFGHHIDIFCQEDDLTEEQLVKAIKFYAKLGKKNAKAKKNKKE